ncbi:MAG: UDP-N-acetylmuramoylalanyl-D-glutamate--2,6-diaminopimelate ligase [Bacteroidetes bacterium]|nr:MAG: UDP-N-acetylmuramoylalanyl-D-glutamate--2,6-diaminopimelate ligase [Bacteroidota bacterium]
MQIEELYKIYLKHPSVQTDTRLLKKDDIFFALKGPNFNGNQFAKQALDSGASYVVVDEDPGFADARLIKVGDTLEALQQLALYHRKQFQIPFIAITGSNGKTTTKELVHAVLSTTYVTYTTQGNLNNHIGIPLTILRIGLDAEFAVIEMGANHQKEIEGYCKIARPTHGIITNVGKAHLEGFGGIEGVKKGKGELYDFLRAEDGTAFVMWDYDYLRDMSKGINRIVTYGTADASVTGIANKSEPFLEIKMTSGLDIPVFQTRLVGSYNLPNVLAAATVGKYFKVDKEKIKSALVQYEPTNSRSQLIEKNGNRIILDAYNANPSSMKLAVENFSKQQGEKVLFLGAMKELGDESRSEHKNLVDMIGKFDWSDVVLVGPEFEGLNQGYRHFTSAKDALEWLKSNPVKNSMVLIKGSRSIRMETLLDAFS